jgi:hypothetical protein
MQLLSVNMSYTVIAMNCIHIFTFENMIFSHKFSSQNLPEAAPWHPPKDPAKISPQILHPGPQNRSRTIVRMPRHLMAAPKITINDVHVLGILNAVNLVGLF